MVTYLNWGLILKLWEFAVQGGFVDNLTGTWRVQGTLAVSRGIGDLHLKEWISAEPELQKLEVTSDCEFLILASDGLWDTVSSKFPSPFPCSCPM
jgi:hypothetical protein